MRTLTQHGAGRHLGAAFIAAAALALAAPHANAAGPDSATSEIQRHGWSQDGAPGCANCHTPCGSSRTHDRRGADPASMAERLPLDAEGRMTCETCHTQPSWPPHGEGGGEPDLLRISNLKRGLCLNCHAVENLPRASVSVAVPPPKAVVHESRVTLLGSAARVDDGRLDIRINGAAFPVQVRGGVFFTRLSLQAGLNVAEIRFRGQRLWQGEIYYADGSDPALQYGRIYQPHLTGGIAECFGCHDRREGLLDPRIASAPELCNRCHDAFGAQRYLHGPLAVGDCVTCHDPHGGTDGAHLRERAGVLCRSCHGANEIAGHSSGIRAVEEGLCTECHDPHEGSSRYLIKSARR